MIMMSEQPIRTVRLHQSFYCSVRQSVSNMSAESCDSLAETSSSSSNASQSSHVAPDSSYLSVHRHLSDTCASSLRAVEKAAQAIHDYFDAPESDGGDAILARLQKAHDIKETLYKKARERLDDHVRSGHADASFSASTTIPAASSTALQLAFVVEKLQELSTNVRATSEQVRATSEQGQRTAAKLEELSTDVRGTKDLIIPLVMAHHNPYSETSSITHQRIPDLRQQVIAASYPLGVLEMPMPGGQMRTVRRVGGKKLERIACMISGQLGNQNQVITAHITPHSAKAMTLAHIGISRQEVDSARNCLLLSKAIEKAFDRMDVSFVPKDMLHPNTFVLKIWTPLGLPPGVERNQRGDARTISLWDGSKFKIGEFEGHELFCGSNSVLTSALSHQAFHAFIRSKTQGWVDAGDSPPDHFGTPERDSSEFLRSRHDYILHVLGDPEARAAAAAAAAAFAAAEDDQDEVQVEDQDEVQDDEDEDEDEDDVEDDEDEDDVEDDEDEDEVEDDEDEDEDEKEDGCAAAAVAAASASR